MDKVQTSLHPTDESNDVNMQNLRMALVPQYEYSHPQYKYVFRLEIPMRIDYIIHKDNLESASSGSWYYSVCPSVYCNYKVTLARYFAPTYSMLAPLGTFWIS